MSIEAKAKCQSVDIMLRVVILVGTLRPIDVHCNQSRASTPLSINLQTRAATSTYARHVYLADWPVPNLWHTCARMHFDTGQYEVTRGIWSAWLFLSFVLVELGFFVFFDDLTAKHRARTFASFLLPGVDPLVFFFSNDSFIEKQTPLGMGKFWNFYRVQAPGILLLASFNSRIEISKESDVKY